MTEFGLRIADSPNTLTPSPVTQDDTVNLSHLLAAIRRRRRAILVPVAVLLVLGLVYLVTTPRTYVASSTLLLDAGANAVVEELVAMDSETLSEGAIENARLVIQSDTIATAVVSELELDRNEIFLNPPQSLFSRLADSVKALVRFPITLLRDAPPISASDPSTPEEVAAAEHGRIARGLSSEIGVQRIGRSGAISVYFASHDPTLAAEVVNAYAEAYIADVLNANLESTERTTEWLQRRLSELEDAAAEAAAEAEAFRAENGLVSSNGRFMSEEAVSELNADLAEAIAEAARSSALVEGYEAVVARGIEGLRSGAPVGTDTTTDPALEELQSGLADAVADLNRITANFGGDHPQALLLSAEIETAAERLFVGVQQRLERARGELSVAQARVTALRGSLGEAVGDNAAAGTAQVELRALEQRAETLSILYQTFLTRFQEIDQQRDFPISDVRILSAAEVPRDADGPRASQVLAVAVVIGLIIGITLAAIREWGDRFIRTSEDVTGLIGLPFLGYLPDTTVTPPQVGPVMQLMQRLRRLAGLTRSASAPADAGFAPDGPILPQNNSIYVETLQNIRLGMDILHASERRHVFSPRRPRDEAETAPVARGVLGITSVRPGEGKTTVALNLAGTLAANGSSVLLIDADMRRPGLSRFLGVTTGPSLVDVALGHIPWTDALHGADPPSLDILPSIRPGGFGHVAELLAAKPIRMLFEEARQHYDHVLVDLAPLGPVVDARVLMRSLGHVLLVTEWGVTPKAMLRNAIHGEPVLAERLLGVVINRVDMSSFRNYVDRSSVDAYLGEYGEYLS
ncbi:MAG: AAA family ATPase [Paracoccaceae bacterium]